jgi:hypothetical protein
LRLSPISEYLDGSLAAVSGRLRSLSTVSAKQDFQSDAAGLFGVVKVCGCRPHDGGAADKRPRFRALGAAHI